MDSVQTKHIQKIGNKQKYVALIDTGVKTAIIKKYYKNQIDEQKILKKKNKLYCENERIVAIQKAVLDKNEIAIFDDGLQQKSLSYDISFVCFNSSRKCELPMLFWANNHTKLYLLAPPKNWRNRRDLRKK